MQNPVSGEYTALALHFTLAFHLLLRRSHHSPERTPRNWNHAANPRAAGGRGRGGSEKKHIATTRRRSTNRDLLPCRLPAGDRSHPPASPPPAQPLNRKLIKAIDEYEGEDPLQPWLACIKWVQDAFPPGGDCSGLVVILEQCVRTFWHEEQYKNDICYLKVWLEYAGFCDVAEVVYGFLNTNKIGEMHAIFYISYATHLESKNKIKTANNIYECGIGRNAQPIEKLKSAYRKFFTRSMSRPKAIEEESMDTCQLTRRFGTILTKADSGCDICVEEHLQSIYISHKVRDDVIRFRYGDEQNLEEALKRSFQYGLGGGVARRNAPILKKILEDGDIFGKLLTYTRKVAEEEAVASTKLLTAARTMERGNAVAGRKHLSAEIIGRKKDRRKTEVLAAALAVEALPELAAQSLEKEVVVGGRNKLLGRQKKGSTGWRFLSDVWLRQLGLRYNFKREVAG
ncbi:hypothetical protein LXL04_020543 [Taraxacum kok-saghyz]